MAIRLQLPRSKSGFDENKSGFQGNTDGSAMFADTADFGGVLLRRSLAYLIDLSILGALAVGFVALTGFLGLITFGLLWIGVGPLMLGLVIGYDALTCGGPRHATPGMRLFGLQMRTLDGGTVSTGQAALQSLGFYISVIFTSFLILAVGLFNPRGRCIHDFASGTMIINAPD